MQGTVARDGTHDGGRPRGRRNRAVGLLLAAALVGTACSNGDDTDTADTAAPATVAAPSTTAVGTPPPTLTGALPGSAYCEQVETSGAIDEVQSADVTDPAGVERAVTIARDALAGITAAAPEPIAADWGVLADTYGRLFDAYAAAGFDFTALMGDVTSAALFEEFAGRQLQDAAARIEQFTAEACGVQLGIGDDAAGTESTADTDSSAVVAPLDDASAALIGAQLLAGFGIEATSDQQACLGRAVSDPGLADSAAADPAGTLERYRALAAGCGIDPTLIPG